MLKRAGRYEIVAELGRGGFGQVYRAFDPTLHSMVAIKTLAVDNDASTLARFRNEAAASRRLNHPNIVTIYDFGEQDGTPYIVMQLLEGQDLQRVIDSRAVLPLWHKIQIMTQIASGLAHAHAHGIVHRDVKPANVMLVPDGDIKIMDFGIALVSRDTQNRLTPRGAVIGTFRYMAPEQFRGLEQDVRGDIFAYGLLFYELLSGIHPFHAAEPAALMYNILNLEPVPIQEVCPGCPEEIQPVLTRLLHKDPEFRYQNLEDVLFDCEPILFALKRERAHDLFEEAQRAVADRQLETGQGLLRQAMELDPSYPGARELRERLQTELRRVAIRPRIEALTNEGREQLSSGNPAEAVQRFEAAARLDPTDTTLKSSLEQARAILEQSRQVTRLAANVERALHEGDLTGAYRIAQQAAELAPADPRARDLVSKAQAALAEQERQLHLAEGLARVRRLIDIRSWEEGSSLLQQLERDFPQLKEIRTLRQTLDNGRLADERRQKLAAGLAAARNEISAGTLEAARDRLVTLRTEFPEAADVEQLLRYTASEIEERTRYELVDRSVNASRELVKRSRFADAVRVLQAALTGYPADPLLERELRSVASAQQQAERNAALNQALDRARTAHAQGRFEEALEALSAFFSKYGSEPAVEELRQTLERDREAAQHAAELRAMVLRVNDLLAKGKAEETIQLLRKPPSALKDHPELTQLRTIAQIQLDRQLERAAALDQAIASANAFQQQNEFDQAAQVLTAFTALHGADPKISALETSIRQGREEFQRRAAEAQRREEEARRQAEASRQRAEEEARRQAADARLRAEEEARRQAEAARQRAEEEARRQAADAQRREEEARRQAEETQRRAEELKRLVSRAEGFLAEGKGLEASQLLGAPPAHFKDHPELTRLRDAAGAQVRQQTERESALKDALASSVSLEQQSRFDQALALLEAFVARHGPDRRIAEREQTVRTARDNALRAAERAAEIAALAKHARTLMAQDDPQGAIALLGRAPGLIEQSPDLRDLLRTAEAQAADRKTRAAVEAIAAEARSLLSRGDTGAAAEAIEGGLKRFPAAAALSSIRAEIEAAETARQLQAFRARAIAQLQSLAAQHEYDRALGVLADAQSRLPGDEQLGQLKTGIEAERQRWAAAQAEAQLQHTLRQARERLATQPADAVAMLQELDARQPGRPDVAAQLAEAREALRRAEDRSLIQEVERLCGQNRFAEAIARLSQAPRDTPELRAARQQVEARRAAAETERIAQAIQSARRDALQNPARALSALEKIQREFPRRPEIDRAVEEMRAAVRSAERESAIAGIQELYSKAKFSKARALHQKTVARFGTDAALDELLARIEAGAAPKPARPTGPPPEPAAGPASLPSQRKPAWVWAASGVAAAAILGTGVWLLTRAPAPAPVRVHFAVRTDPPGAAVQVGDRTCVAPDCQFDLGPGSYTVTARMDGYQPVQRTVTLDAATGSRSENVTLQPVPPAPRQGVDNGTLVVQTGLPEALVFVDEAPMGRTDSRGTLSLTMAAKTHSVRVQKPGYNAPVERQIRIAKNVSQTAVFTLAPQMAKLELRGAPANIEVRADNAVLGRTDGSPVFPLPVTPGDRVLRFSPGAGNRDFPARFEPGGTVTLDWSNIAVVVTPPPAPLPPPPAQPAVDPAERDWIPVSTSTDPAAIQDYMKKYPSSHTQDAQSRLDDAVWARVNQNDPKAVQDYLDRFRNGRHARDASARIAELAWNRADQSNEQQMRDFIGQFPESAHVKQAQSIVDQIEKQKLDAEAKSKQDRAKQDELKQRQTQTAAIHALVDRFSAAFKSRDAKALKEVWPKASPTYLEAIASAKDTGLTLSLQNCGDPLLAGDTATMACDQVQNSQGRTTRVRFTVTLRNAGGQWSIDTLSRQ